MLTNNPTVDTEIPTCISITSSSFALFPNTFNGHPRGIFNDVIDVLFVYRLFFFDDYHLILDRSCTPLFRHLHAVYWMTSTKKWRATSNTRLSDWMSALKGNPRKWIPIHETRLQLFLLCLLTWCSDVAVFCKREQTNCLSFEETYCILFCTLFCPFTWISFWKTQRLGVLFQEKSNQRHLIRKLYDKQDSPSSQHGTGRKDCVMLFFVESMNSTFCIDFFPSALFSRDWFFRTCYSSSFLNRMKRVLPEDLVMLLQVHHQEDFYFKQEIDYVLAPILYSLLNVSSFDFFVRLFLGILSLESIVFRLSFSDEDNKRCSCKRSCQSWIECVSRGRVTQNITMIS